MEDTVVVESTPAGLIGIFRREKITPVEKELIILLEELSKKKKVEKTSKSHENLLKLGKIISESWDIRGREVAEFLKTRKRA